MDLKAILLRVEKAERFWACMEKAESVLVVATSILALFLFRSWWFEREDRHFARVADLVQAMSVCSEEQSNLEAICAEAEGLMIPEIRRELENLDNMHLQH